MDDAGSGSRRNPNPNDTQFFLGQLSGHVNSLNEEVGKFNTRLDRQEQVQNERHETQRREQRETNQTIFEKLDRIAEAAHPTPCPKLQGVCSDVSDAETDIRELRKEQGKLGRKVGTMKTAGSATWRTIVIVALTISGLAAIIIPLLVWLWPKG